MKIIGLSGSLSDPSRSAALVAATVEAAASALAAPHELLTIAAFAPVLVGATNPAQLPPALRDVQRRLEEADLLVIGTPIYKAAYAGLLKHFFDLLDPESLRGKVAILAATGGSTHHALVLEHQLRPLLGFFGVHTVPTTLFAADASFTKDAQGDYRLTDESLLARITGSVEQARDLLIARRAPWRDAA